MTQLEPLAVILDKPGGMPTATLVRHRQTGILSAYDGAAASSVPRDKALAALAALAPPDGDSELAELVKAWRERADISARRAAEILGIPERTLEGIEQGRGFRYPRLLTLALQAFDVPAGR